MRNPEETSKRQWIEMREFVVRPARLLAFHIHSQTSVAARDTAKTQEWQPIDTRRPTSLNYCYKYQSPMYYSKRICPSFPPSPPSPPDSPLPSSPPLRGQRWTPRAAAAHFPGRGRLFVGRGKWKRANAGGRSNVAPGNIYGTGRPMPEPTKYPVTCATPQVSLIRRFGGGSCCPCWGQWGITEPRGNNMCAKAKSSGESGERGTARRRHALKVHRSPY